MKRRSFLKCFGAASGTALVAKSAWSAPPKSSPLGKKARAENYAVLVDTTLCEGCQSCEEACAEVNGLPEPNTSDGAFDKQRQSTPSQWSVVNRFKTSGGEVFVKRQCMHCLQPACAAACLTKAMLKTKQGPVVWREDKCMGCRYCMVSCPFEVPKFEYNSPRPRIQKCRFCWDRLKQGEKPACVAECPNDALYFGTREEVLGEARRRVFGKPGKYVPHIYGEHEAGGTSWIYIASVPFSELGFRADLGTTAYPVYTREFLYAVPVVLVLWPAFLLALWRSTRLQAQLKAEQGDD